MLKLINQQLLRNSQTPPINFIVGFVLKRQRQPQGNDDVIIKISTSNCLKYHPALNFAVYKESMFFVVNERKFVSAIFISTISSCHKKCLRRSFACMCVYIYVYLQCKCEDVWVFQCVNIVNMGVFTRTSASGYLLVRLRVWVIARDSKSNGCQSKLDIFHAHFEYLPLTAVIYVFLIYLNNFKLNELNR